MAGYSQNVSRPFLRYLARHNRRMLVLLIFSCFAVALLWGALFLGVYWLTLLALTLGKGTEAVAPAEIWKPFIIGALLACSATWFVSKVLPGNSTKERGSLLTTFWHLILALPNATLGLLNLARGFHCLNRSQKAVAWDLLQSIHKERGMDYRSLPLAVPNPVLAEHLVLNLQLVGLVELRRTSTGLRLQLRGEEARTICQPMVRFAKST